MRDFITILLPAEGTRTLSGMCSTRRVRAESARAAAQQRFDEHGPNIPARTCLVTDTSGEFTNAFAPERKTAEVERVVVERVEKITAVPA